MKSFRIFFPMGMAILVVGIESRGVLALGGPGDPQHHGQPPGHSGPSSHPAPSRPVRSRPQQPQRPVIADRPYHGTVRHSGTHIIERPVDEHHGNWGGGHGFIHRDVDVDFGRNRYWHGFVYGRHHHELRGGFVQLYWNGAPYFYDDGIYYQSAADGYQEIYPPVGLGIPTLPSGFVESEAGGLVYYYGAGAFYLSQGEQFVIAPAPIGVIVPEFPPGAVLVTIAGAPAFQFNGVYYRPVFVNGVTQYQTFLP